MKRCAICNQKADLYTTVHRKEPFADGRNYEIVCFTCYFVPKTLEQRYDSNGAVSEEVDIPYSCGNLCDPKGLYESGAADSLRHAKTCTEAVKSLCAKALKSKIPEKRPKASWNID